MATKIHGDTSNLKASQAKALARFHDRSVAPDLVVAPALARDVLALSHELNRQIGLFIDRRGRVTEVILGDAHSIDVPEFSRARGVDGRLAGVRLLITHLVSEGLNREELSDLTKLRFDLLAAIHTGPAGIQVDLAALRPGAADQRESFTVQTWPRVPLSLLQRDDDPRVDEFNLPTPFDEFLRTREAALVSSRATARAEVKGVRAMVLMVHPGDSSLEPRKSELLELCRTAGVGVVDVVVQKRSAPHPKTFMGSGKLREVLVQALEQDVEVLICDPELSGTQSREVAAMTDLKVIDRTMLILDIFAQHAQSSDGKLQVELAQLRYRLPRMVGKGTAMSRLAGGIGGRGPGETKLEIDRRRAQSRITDLERRLDKMKRHREQGRARRKRSEVPVVAIVGYTNAGKSTLLNTVTQSEVRAEDKLFATLDPTVRRMRFPQEREIVMLDTVGFIRDLPPALRQAFSATLEEVAEADLLLHVVDITDPDQDQQVKTVQSLLEELGASSIPRLLVYNKCDELPALAQDAERPRDQFFVSALDRRTTRALMDAIEARFFRAA